MVSTCNSISAAVRMLIKNEGMRAVFMGEEDVWIDVDTPEAYRYCLDRLGLSFASVE